MDSTVTFLMTIDGDSNDKVYEAVNLFKSFFAPGLLGKSSGELEPYNFSTSRENLDYSGRKQTKRFATKLTQPDIRLDCHYYEELYADDLGLITKNITMFNALSTHQIIVAKHNESVEPTAGVFFMAE